MSIGSELLSRFRAAGVVFGIGENGNPWAKPIDKLTAEMRMELADNREEILAELHHERRVEEAINLLRTPYDWGSPEAIGLRKRWYFRHTLKPAE